MLDFVAIVLGMNALVLVPFFIGFWFGGRSERLRGRSMPGGMVQEEWREAGMEAGDWGGGNQNE